MPPDEELQEEGWVCGWCAEEGVEEGELCQGCEDSTANCDDCGDRQWAQDLNRVRYNNDVCDSCSQNYGTCEHCSDTYHENDLYYCERIGGSHCEGCERDCEEDEIDENGLHNYDYKPPLTFLGPSDDNLYLGVELEIDDGEIDEVVPNLQAMPEHDRVFYLKEDGSLSSDGVEIVTHPATLARHLDGTIPWQQILTIAKKHGYTSHDARTCGLHVHLSRRGLGGGQAAQESTLSNMILFVWRHWTQVRKLSRRTDGQMMWCQPNHEAVPDFEPEPMQVGHPSKDKVESAKQVGRHVVLNNTNSDTIELRLFRGTLRLETLIATLQFSHHLVTFCRGKGAIDIVTGTWGGFTARLPQELKDYLEVRNV